MTTRCIWIAGLLAGCVPTDGESRLPPPQDFTEVTGLEDATDVGGSRSVVLTTGPLIPDGPLMLTVTGANPGEQVHLARSSAGFGAGPCLGAAGLLCLDITSPALLGSAVADAYGVAVLTATMPPTLTIGADLWLQTVIARGASGAAWVKSAPLEVPIVDAPLNVATLAPGDLVITEVMQNPSAVSDADGEWFEVHNPTALDANLGGIEVTDWVADSFVISDSLFLPAGGYIVLARNGDPATNGGVEAHYTYGNMELGNGIDEIHLLAGATFVDSVTWDDGLTFPDPVGASMKLTRLFVSAAANDAGASWAESSESYGDGDLGSPGGQNPFVPPDPGFTSSAGVLSGDDWVVCRADSDSAWLNADTFGEYNAEAACQSVGYTTVTQWSGTGGDVCTIESFGYSVGDPTYLAFTVHWLCE